MSVQKIEARFVSLGSSRGQILFKEKKKKCEPDFTGSIFNTYLPCDLEEASIS